MNLFKKIKLPKLRLPSLRTDKDAPRREPNYLIWAFLLPFLGMLAVMVIGRSEPFGSTYSMLYSDMYHQYYPFFVAFRKSLLSGESLLYSWDVGMGMDYLGLISYYLASPLNLLSVFIPENYTLEYFSLLAPIKLGLAGLFFGIFLKRMFHKNDFSIAIFGGFYGLCAWAFGYHWNVMWLDGFALLPLVVLGTIYLLRDKKFILYTITLTLAVFINYYIGLFVCFFVFLLFFCYEICCFQDFKRFCADLGRIALFSVLAIGMTTIMTLPALAALQNTYSSVNAFPDSFSLNIVERELVAPAAEAWNAYKDAKLAGSSFFETIGLFFVAMGKSFAPLMEGMRQVAGNISGSHTHTLKEGLPNLYSGVGTIILAFLFLTAKEIKLQEKLCSVGLLVFFMLSFLIRQLDYIWHGFHFPNMIPYRFSFLFSFVLLYMAYRAWLLRENFKLWQFIVAGVLSLGLMMCSDKRSTFIFLSYNIALLLLFLGIFIYVLIDRQMDLKSKEPLPVLVLERREQLRSKYCTLALLAVMVLELMLNTANFGTRFTFTYVTNYPQRYENVSAAVRYMNEREDDHDFYRAEVTHAQTLNDSALLGYDGISTFTSSANVRVTEFMAALGYSARNNYNRYCYEDGSPVSNLFLNLKYMIDRTDNVMENAYFDNLYEFKNVNLLENNVYLPLGFLAESSLAQWDKDMEGNMFEKQNELFRLATGTEADIWTSIANDLMTVTGSNVNITTQTSKGYTLYNNDKKGTLTYTYQVDRDGFLCFQAQMSAQNNFVVSKNGKELYSESISLHQMFAVCDVQVGDTITIDITCKAGTNGSVSIRTGILDEQLFREGYEILAASTMELTEFSNTKVEGTIDCNRDGLLYTSIPYDGNWDVTVDGQSAEVVLVGDCMMALKLTKGSHTIRFSYHNDAFTYGCIVTLLCAAVFVGLILLSRRPPKPEKDPEEIPEAEKA